MVTKHISTSIVIPIPFTTILFQYPSTNPLLANGWRKVSLGQHRTKKNNENVIEEIKDHNLYVRETPIDEFLKNSSKASIEKSHKHKGCEVGSSVSMGSPKSNLTPTSQPKHELITSHTSQLPTLGNFDLYKSLVAMRPDKPCLLIGFDSEWQNLASGFRDMLTWQFAVVWDGKLIEFIFLKVDDKRLTMNMALACILDYLDFPSVDVRKIRRYKYCVGWEDEDTKPIVKITKDVKEARDNCVYVYRDREFTHEKIKDMSDYMVKRSERDWAWFHSYLDYKLVDAIPVTLLCHTGKVDISALNFDKGKNLLKYLTEVQGGLVTLQPVRIAPTSLKNVSNQSVYPVTLNVADTMCHAPAGMKSLKTLGEVVGIEKVELPEGQKENMLELLENDPDLFFEYASTDSVVTLMYSSSLYGYNNTPPVTITSASATVMKGTMMEYLKCNDTDEFNKKYRGLKKVSHGNFSLENRAGFVEATSLEPINDKSNTILYYSSQAYHGGYNGCSEVGYFPFLTWDYDLQNAYPTAMCLVPDIDWEDPIRFEIRNEQLKLSLWKGIGGLDPTLPFVGYVRFRFPDNVKYPCIPVNVDGVPCYPRSSDGLDGVYVAGAFIFLALKLGAEVFCETGYFLNSLMDDNGNESRSLSYAVKQLVLDRNQAKKEQGKKSLEELILKTMVNSGYGKNAQNVIPKASWTAYKDLMEDLGCSAITNPVSAMLTTSLVQCELLAAQNQIQELGYIACSVTTDGFISNCPEDVLKSLDLYGFRKFMEQSRLFLTDGKDPELWEPKHYQDDLINFTTRGNVSLLSHGVCAHNSTKSGFPSDSFEDREWLMLQVLSRTGKVVYTQADWEKFKNMVRTGIDFNTKQVARHISMDFDLKRKPDRDSFRTDKVVINGVEYEIAHFDTVPYETVEEFRTYRKKKKSCEVLRTEADWKIFWMKLDMNATGSQIHTDLDWAILNSCIMGFRAERWDIPQLNVGTVQEKCDWINTHNTSKKQFKQSDWKNARRPERQVNMLPKEMIEDKLYELINDIK